MVAGREGGVYTEGSALLLPFPSHAPFYVTLLLLLLFFFVSLGCVSSSPADALLYLCTLPFPLFFFLYVWAFDLVQPNKIMK